MCVGRPIAPGLDAPPAARDGLAMPALSPKLLPILFLIGSNLFMTVAWYGHLKFKDRPLWLVIMVSWGIAFFVFRSPVPGH